MTLDELITLKLSEKTPLIIAADGMCAAGKTTWAEAFAAGRGAALVHMDDFFAQPHDSRLGVAADLDRVKNEVIDPFLRGESLRFIPFNCAVQTPGSEIIVPRNDILVLEGVYSMHPFLRDDYGIKLFFEIDPEEQKRRLLARNGPVYLERFINEWIPNENRYFGRYKVREAADITYSGTEITNLPDYAVKR